GLLLNSQLRPSDGLAELFQRAITAGKGNEGIGEICHERLALVHGLDYMQLGHAAMADFAMHQRLRNHADNFTTFAQRCIGERTHQTDAPAAEDHADATFRQKFTESLRRLLVRRARTDRRTTKNTDALEFGHRKSTVLHVLRELP